MELNILEESKKKMIFKIKGEGHTLTNLLEKELYNDSDIIAAGYFVDHPLVGVPRMVVETNGKKTPRKALVDAAKRLKKQTKAFSSAIKKIK